MKRNYEMDVLSAMAIVFVVLGHIFNGEDALFTFYGFFPYYSFHMPLFLFISGYFFKDQDVVLLIRKKAKTLIAPYIAYNTFFLIIQTMLRKCGYNLGWTFSVETALVYPFIKYQPNNFSIPSWYLYGLFIAEIMYQMLRNIVMQYMKEKTDGKKNVVITVLVIILSFIGSVVMQTCEVQFVGVIVRSVFMVFFINAGFIYRNNLEEKDTVRNDVYFPVLFMIQGILIVLFHNMKPDFGLWGLDGIDKYLGIHYFIFGITGIALWLRIAKNIGRLPESRILQVIGQNTKYIMIFHLFGSFLLNTLFSYFVTNQRGLNYLSAFNMTDYRNRIYYVCIAERKMILIYLIGDILFSLCIAVLIEKTKHILKKYIDQAKAT